MRVTSKEQAWIEANKLFPTDYEKDEASSLLAGYDIYRHHTLNYYNRISANDLRDTLAFFRQDEPKISPAPVALSAKYQSVAPKVRNIADYIHAGKKRGEAQ